jgi:anti-anti-sigma regulatory factor
LRSVFALKTGLFLPRVHGTSVALFSPKKNPYGMLKITIVEDQRRRRVIVEGKLIAPWAAELSTTYQTAKKDLQDCELVVDLRSLTAISSEGEEVLLQLMREKAKFLSGVYVREVLKQLDRKNCDSLRDEVDERTSSSKQTENRS